MHRWTPEIMGRGRWRRRINLTVVVAGQQQLAAVVLHLVAKETVTPGFLKNKIRLIISVPRKSTHMSE
jgi:hypothetical protein